ncbi:NDH1 [Auxenochlorella protothecoides x Auxenochlorella symbiontica]
MTLRIALRPAPLLLRFILPRPSLLLHQLPTRRAGHGPGQRVIHCMGHQAGATQPPTPPKTIHFCSQCAGPVDLRFVSSEDRWRHICSACSHVHYINPRNVVGCIVEHEDQVLLCRRGIQPQLGKWTVPAGYMELQESTAEGAARETLEEAGAAVEIVAPYVHFDIPGIGQAYLLFRARLAPPFTFAAQAPESLETRLFPLEDIPWNELAFSAVSLALRYYVEDRRSQSWRMHHGVIRKQAGAGPNDPGSFKLTDYMGLPLGAERIQTQA